PNYQTAPVAGRLPAHTGRFEFLRNSARGIPANTSRFQFHRNSGRGIPANAGEFEFLRNSPPTTLYTAYRLLPSAYS
ncbi:MAG: hypothetical protein P1T08_16135, partial [Acidimicrobiia bacterium]|nr:hypothetical protein [Acidimicrobiia bacterium]